MIKFKTNTTLQIIEEFDEISDTITGQCEDTFKAGEPVDAEVIGEHEDGTVDLEFGDGSVSLRVDKNSFEIWGD